GQESDVDMERVSHWYDVLMDFDHGELNARIRQNTFLSAGFFARLDGDTDKAIELWQRGLQEVNLDNIELLGVLVTEVSAKQERSNTDVQLANKSLQDLRSAVARKKTELRELSIQELTDAERTAILRTVEIAAWRASVSEAILRRTNEYVAPESDEDDGRDPDEIVIDLLKRALGDPAEVGVDERVRVATVLAELFRRTGAWDQAAETLSKACEVMPGNLTLQLQAAEAWTRAGNQLKAIEHWRVAQASDGLPIRVAAAHGTLNYQLRRAPESQDFSTVRQEAVELRERMDAALEASADSPERKEELDASNAYLRILEISIPSPGTTPAEHLASRTVAEQFAALAEDFPSNALLQAYAAERLAAVGIDGAAEEAVERLVALEGKDSSRVAITRARQIALRGQPVAAARELMKFMQEHPKDQAAIDIARIAADFANRADETGLAYEVTVLLPEETRSPKIAYTLYRMATRLGETKKAEQHLAELRTLEGDNGTYWRFIDIENIVLKLSARNTVIERNDSEMNRAQGMLSELIARRPRWGQALALRAWLSVLAGFDERSVDQLRQAIAAGDQRLSTRRLYWSQLMRLKEYAAADEDIKNTAMASGVDLDPYSEMQISVSLGKGDLNEALEEARRAVSNKPDDPISHLIVAKTASIAAISQRQGNSTPEVIAETEKLVDEARDAIKKAIALSGDVDYPILSTQLAIEIAHGDVASVTALEKQLLENDDLGLHYQMVLLGQTSVYLNEMDEAIARYKQADDARPTLQTKLALATLYSRLGRHDQEARILRSAIGLTPRNAEVRERLAEAIISRDGDNVDWAELSKLLTEGNGVNPSNRLLYATMLGSSEDDARLRESLRILRALVLENNSKSYLASLTLGAVLIKVAGRIPETAADRETKQSTFLDEARTLYARNAQSIQASIDDFYRFAVYLLQYGSKDDWDEVDRLAERLDSTEGGILRALELQIILRQKRGQGKSIPKWLDGWAEKSKGKPGAQNNEIDLAAGTALIKLGFAEQGIALFRKVYDSDPSQLFNYVIALTQINRYDEAATVAAEHFGKFEDAQSAMLLVEAILGAEEPRAYSKYSDLLERATKLHERDAPLLDSVATLAMQSGRVRTAITLYHSVLELDPQRLRTLNNLAMAYSQIPNQAVRGLKVIDRALEVVTGPARAELLDTKGTLLMEAKQYERAIEVFDEAIEIRDDPRFHFHKVLVLIRQERLSDATRQWTMLDRKRINTKGLTKEEQSIYSRMLKDYEVRGRQADYEVRSL
ncbi:MAG: tetratricopeptide repeat protein, partial [Planctomycetota bacterium]